MIRRPPTLIPINDTDIQTARDFVEEKKVEAQGCASSYLDKILAQEAHNAAQEAEKQRRILSKEERLGLTSDKPSKNQ
jgi:hypothetical protein